MLTIYKFLIEKIVSYFRLKELCTDIRTEIIAGVTTFVTMAYIIVVNPAILEAAGIPKGPSTVATILSAFFGTILMGLYARRPFAVAPYMGENAFIAYTVVKVLGYSWQTALGAVFIGGLLFTLLTIFKLRSWFANSIPNSLKYSFSTGLGLFLAFIGLNVSGLVRLGVEGAPVKMGNLLEPQVLLAIFSLILISIFLIKKIKGAILFGILATTFLAILFGITNLPDRWISLPPSLAPIFLKLDIFGALTWGFFSVVLTVFVMDFVDTMATLIGVSAKAGLLDKEGNLPEIEKPMLCDALATSFGALLGTTTTGAFIESASGVQEGGRSGLTAVVVSFLFLAALFLSPFLTIIPACAYGPALIVVGILMFEPIKKIDFDDLTEVIPAFCVIVFICFTYNLGIGITAGFILYPFLKLVSGRISEVRCALWALAFLSLLFFIFYPYHK